MTIPLMMEQCINFCLNPHINPITNKPFEVHEKHVYELILWSCRDIDMNEVFKTFHKEQYDDNYSGNTDIEINDDINLFDHSASETNIGDVQSMDL